MKYKDILGYSEPKKKVIKEKVEKSTITEELINEFGPLNEFSHLTEGKELNQQIIVKIAKLTDQNNHTEARVVLAKALRNKDLEKAYHAINTIHIYLRRANETNIARNALDKKLFKYAKQKFSNYKEISGAF